MWTLCGGVINSIVSMNIYETTIRGRSRMASCLHKAGVGNNTYRLSNSQYVVRSISNQPVPLPSSLLNTMYNAWGKIETISLNKYNGNALSMDIVYGPDQERWCSEYTAENGSVRETVYAGNYEKVTENGITREFYYLDGNVIIVRENGGVFTPYLAFKDNLGSFLSIWDAEGEKVFDADYDAWGKQEVYLNDIGFQRGYTGHEMWNEFGIINMNGRLYDPTIARFLSPDNYVQAPDNSQSFNRYSYCLNNPLKYTDPSGEKIKWWGWVLGAFLIDPVSTLATYSAVEATVLTTATALGTTAFSIGTSFISMEMTPLGGTTLALGIPSKNYAQKVKNSLKIDAGLFRADGANVKDKILQFASRFTWELPQTKLGHNYSHTRNFLGLVDRVDYSDGATFCTNEYTSDRNGITMGCFININIDDHAPMDESGHFSPASKLLYMHEYGHYIQSQQYGWGDLFSVGLPSICDLAFGNGKDYSFIHDELYQNHDLKWFERNASKKAKTHFRILDEKWDYVLYPIEYPY